jgi:DNA-binding transcriptional LysR family regulator
MSLNDYFTRDIRLRHLRLLVAIDEAGRLTRAARLLHVTQPALSKALSEIERSIGLPLFDRTPSGLTPTPHGATLVRAARAALAEIERAGAELRRPPGPPALRILDVGVMPTAGRTIVAAAVARLRALHPELTVRIVDGPTGALLPQLVAGRLHLILGARVRATPPDGVETLFLYDDPMQLVVAAKHPLSRLRVPRWERLAAVPWVLPPTGHPTRIAFDRALRRLGWPSPTVIVEALSSDTVVALVEAMGAIALTSGRLAALLEARGTAREIAPAVAQALSISLAVTVFAAPASLQDPGVAALVRCLRDVSAQSIRPHR